MDVLEQDQAWHLRLSFYRELMERACAATYRALDSGKAQGDPEYDKPARRHARLVQRHGALCRRYCAWAETQIAVMNARRK